MWKQNKPSLIDKYGTDLPLINIINLHLSDVNYIGHDITFSAQIPEQAIKDTNVEKYVANKGEPEQGL